MPEQPPAHADELKTRERFLRVGCAANIGLLLLLLAGIFAVSSVMMSLLRNDDRPGPAPADASSDEAMMRAVLDAQVAAWNKGDLDGFMAGYWRDGRLTFISGDRITRGWDATRERYLKKYFTPGPDGRFSERGDLAFEELEVQRLSADVGVIRGRYVLRLTAETAVGRFTLILRKWDHGWRITSDHTSVDCKK